MSTLSYSIFLFACVTVGTALPPTMTCSEVTPPGCGGNPPNWDKIEEKTVKSDCSWFQISISEWSIPWLPNALSLPLVKVLVQELTLIPWLFTRYRSKHQHLEMAKYLSLSTHRPWTPLIGRWPRAVFSLHVYRWMFMCGVHAVQGGFSVPPHNANHCVYVLIMYEFLHCYLDFRFISRSGGVCMLPCHHPWNVVRVTHDLKLLSFAACGRRADFVFPCHGVWRGGNYRSIGTGYLWSLERWRWSVGGYRLQAGTMSPMHNWYLLRITHWWHAFERHLEINCIACNTLPQHMNISMDLSAAWSKCT